jgi:hypothetical protein
MTNNLVSEKDITRMNIELMTKKWLEDGNEITKIKPSIGQRGKVRFEHGFRRGRIGWFECK